MPEFEIYVVDEVRASVWNGALVKQGDVVSRATDDCDTPNCQACGTLHGVASSETLEKNGLAARRV